MSFVSKITLDDIIEVEDIGKKCLPIYYNRNDLIVLTLNNYILIKISDKENILGFCICQLFEEENRIHIMSIGIEDKCRRNGCGTKLINYLKENYNHDISLNVQVSNDIAIKFYKKNNFIVDKILENYYNNLEVKDAYYMKYKQIINK